MRYNDFDDYLAKCEEKDNLTKITPEIERDAETGDKFVVKTKEVYEFQSECGWEDENDCSDALVAAEAFIKECCALTNCVEHKKKFKKGKYSKKEDDIVAYGKFIVTVAFTH